MDGDNVDDIADGMIVQLGLPDSPQSVGLVGCCWLDPSMGGTHKLFSLVKLSRQPIHPFFLASQSIPCFSFPIFFPAIPSIHFIFFSPANPSYFSRQPIHPIFSLSIYLPPVELIHPIFPFFCQPISRSIPFSHFPNFCQGPSYTQH